MFFPRKLPTDAELKKGITSEDLNYICLILNTADYCYSESEGLENKLMKTIDATLKDQASLEGEREFIIYAVDNCGHQNIMQGY